MIDLLKSRNTLWWTQRILSVSIVPPGNTILFSISFKLSQGTTTKRAPYAQEITDRYTANGAFPSGLTRRSSIFPMVSLISFRMLLPMTLDARWPAGSFCTPNLARSTVCDVNIVDTCPYRPEKHGIVVGLDPYPSVFGSLLSYQITPAGNAAGGIFPSPVAATATPVPSAAEQQHNYDDNQEQLHRHGNLRSFRERPCCGSKAAVLDLVNYLNAHAEALPVS